MKTLILTLFTLSLSVFVSAQGTPPSNDTNTQDHCSNYNTPNLCEYCNDCGKIVKLDTSNDDCVEDEGEKEKAKNNACTTSFVETLSYSYIHDVTEYSVSSIGEGCGPCSGGSAVGGSSFPGITFERFHKFREMAQRGSFGPGIFSNFDVYMTLFVSGGQPRVDMYFAGDISNRRYFKQGDKFFETFSRTSKELVLYDINGNVTTAISDAVLAELKSFKDLTFTFELFEEDETTKNGRLKSYINRNGYGITVNYIHALDATVDSADKFKMSSVSDSSNRTIAIEYHPGKKKGCNVISKLTLPNGSDILYQYGESDPALDTDDPLTNVHYPDNTESTFEFETTANETLVHIFEASEQGTHRRKTVHLSNNFGETPPTARDGQQYFNQASLLINRLKIGSDTDNETNFAIYQNPNGGNNRRVYEGGNKLKSVNIVSAKFYKSWSTTTGGETGFDNFTGLQSEATASQGDWKFYSGNAQGRPPLMQDDHGNDFKYLYNSDNRLTKKIYEDGTIKRWSYNELNLQTRERDRLGRVSHKEYDDRGNLTREIVGLKAEVSGSVGDELPGLLARIYDWTGDLLPTNFAGMSAVETAAVPNVDINVSDRDERYAMSFDGFIEITQEGDYSFFLSSDDGSKLYINGVEVIDNDGLHGNREVSTETPLTLTAGKHAIRVEFFEKYGAQILNLEYSGPDSEDLKVTVPDSVYSHFTVEEELAETDVTTPDTAERNLTYYPAGHANQYLLHTEEDFN
ncbi:MAG: PA14 domain-containing protein, partial [Lentisphaeraceae bacterium]|nr:PA14 domain-containing protein [Lentisphaeraceae bacterium]